MTYWQIWLSIGLVLFALEVFTSGFVLGCLGIGAFLTVLFTLIVDTSLPYQLIIFAIGSLLSLVFIRPLVTRLYGEDVPMNIYSLVGKIAIVSKEFDPNTHIGRVKIDGDDWRALVETEEDASELSIGSPVSIVKVDSNTLIIKPKK